MLDKLIVYRESIDEHKKNMFNSFFPRGFIYFFFLVKYFPRDIINTDGAEKRNIKNVYGLIEYGMLNFTNHEMMQCDALYCAHCTYMTRCSACCSMIIRGKRVVVNR